MQSILPADTHLLQQVQAAISCLDCHQLLLVTSATNPHLVKCVVKSRPPRQAQPPTTCHHIASTPCHKCKHSLLLVTIQPPLFVTSATIHPSLQAHPPLFVTSATIHPSSQAQPSLLVTSATIHSSSQAQPPLLVTSATIHSLLQVQPHPLSQVQPSLLDTSTAAYFLS